MMAASDKYFTVPLRAYGCEGQTIIMGLEVGMNYIFYMGRTAIELLKIKNVKYLSRKLTVEKGISEHNSRTVETIRNEAKKRQNHFSVGQCLIGWQSIMRRIAN